jgi:glyoxylase-like metal-dependent hydrolase (beta-lactamase superfamily II)
MQRRSFLKNTAFTIGTLALIRPSALANLLADPAYKIKMLTDSIGMFTEKGGTILFMLSKKGVVVVDSQFPDSAQHLIDEIKKKSEKPFRLLINTHHHGDHSAGNIAFKGMVAHVLAHANSKTNQQAVAAKQKSEDKQLYPDQTYTDTWCEKVGKEKICLHYFGAGHTNGDSFVHFQHSNIVHVGDLVFNRRHPYIDKTAGADINSWIQVLNKATETFDKKTIYVSGHAAAGYDTILNGEEVLLFRDYLGNLLKFTESALKAGKSKEDILKATGIPGSPQWTGDGIQRPLTAAIEELSKK